MTKWGGLNSHCIDWLENGIPKLCYQGLRAGGSFRKAFHRLISLSGPVCPWKVKLEIAPGWANRVKPCEPSRGDGLANVRSRRLKVGVKSP